MITRRHLLRGALAAIPAGGCYPVLVEPRWLEVTHTKVKVKTPVRQPLKILQLTDLHWSWCVPTSLIEDAIERGLANNPDIVCLTGDFITRENDVDQAAYLQRLRRLALARPTFAVLGNHDSGTVGPLRSGFTSHRFVERLLEDAGIHLLHNRSQSIDIRGQKWCLAGIGDLWSGEAEPENAFQGAGQDMPRVLLAHNPDSKVVVQPYRWDLMICGHTHGGQVMVPFEGPRYAPVRDKRFVAGLRPWDTRQIYVSRGVGNLGGIRWMCRPEVTLLELSQG
ncbi:phosphodiesterase YaeI [Paludibaculum fermentans]|uniref:Phosphodiesterase YaeI n=1 Tax=Paludibaculum fermentans TaxID=1473598 RepID=A0A7S7SK26_PALFE|nr:phosphodiesterase YaeI [Paludibaculum fermentans]QOY87338.1 phosphodiesterase YaeI [Paludibaculum fermentans]